MSGLQLQCKCFYALDKAGVLKKRPALLSIFDDFFSAHIDVLKMQNFINIASIFAKHHNVVSSDQGPKSYFKHVECYFTEGITLPAEGEDYDMSGESRPTVEKRLPENARDLTLLLNTYKNVSFLRELTQGEWRIVNAIQDKFFKLMSNVSNMEALHPQDLALMIYCMGMLDIGRPASWALLEDALLKHFHKLKKIDFDQSLAGFYSSSKNRVSMTLHSMFIRCTMMNYALSPEDFILAASYLSKDRDRRDIDLNFWELAIKILMGYI